MKFCISHTILLSLHIFITASFSGMTSCDKLQSDQPHVGLTSCHKLQFDQLHVWPANCHDLGVDRLFSGYGFEDNVGDPWL